MIDHDSFFSELCLLLGEDYLVVNKDEVEKLARVTIHKRVLPIAFAYPENTVQAQQIILLATKYKIPLWVASRGNNWGYGAATPFKENSLVVILERMNKIIEVNEELAYAVIEAGVSYEQLNRYLKENNINLWIDCTDGTPNGSVIGNAMERGIGETPYGDHFGSLCGLEVILPDSTIIHTGGSSPNHPLKTWHLHKWGIGPYLEGIFTQSNFGIVTKAGIWLMPKPQAFQSYVFELRREDKFAEVIDAFRKLALQGIVNTKLHMINDFVSLTVLTQKNKEIIKGKDYLTDDDLKSLRNKYKVAPWSGGGGLYGTKDELRVQRKIMHKELGKYGRLMFLNDTMLWGLSKLVLLSKKCRFLETMIRLFGNTSIDMLESAPYVHGILQGIPTEYFVNHAYYKHPLPRPTRDVHPARDNCGLIWFAPILPMSGQRVTAFLDLCKTKYQEYGFDFYVAMLMLNPRSVVPLMSIIFDRETELEKAGELYDALLELMYKNNYQQYRAGVQSWEHLFDHAPEYASLNEKIKKALDPENILAPGKYGIS
ncbi:MAG: FAD-binding oxidoreductase [Methylococcaceae bacterium]